VFYPGTDNNRGYIECNDCDAVIRTLPAADLRQALNEMEAGLEFATEKCRHCGNVNLIPGFSVMMVYTCRECGEVVQLSDDPQIDRFGLGKMTNE
jgi:ribosomal protein S27E